MVVLRFHSNPVLLVCGTVNPQNVAQASPAIISIVHIVWYLYVHLHNKIQKKSQHRPQIAKDIIGWLPGARLFLLRQKGEQSKQEKGGNRANYLDRSVAKVEALCNPTKGEKREKEWRAPCKPTAVTQNYTRRGTTEDNNLKGKGFSYLDPSVAQVKATHKWTWGRGWMTKASGVGERRKGRGELRRDCHHRVAALFVPTRMQQWYMIYDI